MSHEFQRALHAGNVPRVIMMFAEGTATIDEVDSHGMTALMHGTGLPMVQLLVESGASTDTKDVWGRTALMRAARRLPYIGDAMPIV